MFKYSILTGVLVAIGIAIITTNVSQHSVKKKNSKQLKVFENILVLDSTNTSANIIGSYKDNPIYEYITIQNKSKSGPIKFSYYDIIPFNSAGHLMVLPKEDEVFTSCGIIYKEMAGEKA